MGAIIRGRYSPWIESGHFFGQQGNETAISRSRVYKVALGYFAGIIVRFLVNG
jgi:hypothetical protein